MVYSPWIDADDLVQVPLPMDLRDDYVDHVDELLSAGAFAHGAALTDGAMRVNTCQCRVCENRRSEIGIPTRTSDGRPFPIFIDRWGRVAMCPCSWCSQRDDS
jgi:hypothetical protein